MTDKPKLPLVVNNAATGEYYFAEHCHITEWWNSPWDAACSVARARVEPGVTTRLHRLNGVMERYVILAGQGQVKAGDLPTTRVGSGDVVIIPPGTPQQITNSGDVDLAFLAICTPRFRPEVYEDLDSTGG